MDENIISLIAKELNISISQVKNTLELLEEGATVPFIARYRKERTKGLDEEQIRVIQENYAYQVNLAKRKEEVLARIETLGKLDDEIIKNVNACTKLSQVEDIYRPYKQKKKTRASVAIANGLQPLADTFMSFPRYFKETELDAYINENVKDRETAIQGACDIIAEKVSDDVDVRNKILDSMTNFGRIVTSEKKGHEDNHKVYKMYYDYSERVNTLAPHRVMAIDRGEKEKVLNVSISFNEEYIENWVCRRFIRFTNSGTSEYVRAAILDGLKPLMEGMGIESANVIAIAAATYGLVAGSLMGGPTARGIINKYNLKSTESETGVELNDMSEADREKAERVDVDSFTNAAILLIVASGLGTLLTAALNGIEINIGNFHFSFTFPTYIGAMLIAAVIRNFCDAKNIVLPSRALDLWGNVSLSIFLAIALMSVALWQLASVAVAMIAMLAAQTILMYFYARFVVYNIMGRDYEAAVMTAAFCGFGMGATPNAMANMQAVTKRFGPAPQAYFIVPLVGSLFIDFFNGLIITGFLNVLPIFG